MPPDDVSPTHLSPGEPPNNSGPPIAQVAIEYVIGLASDERGRPRALLVIGTATEQMAREETLFSVGFSYPAYSRLEPARYEIDRANIPVDLAVPAGSALWSARFECNAHPSLHRVHFGVQAEQLEIGAVVISQGERIEIARARISYIGRSGYGCAVGVLFVHGIGPHQRGQTLVSAGEPVVRFIQDWLEGVTEKWSRSWSSDEREEWIERVTAQLRHKKASLRELALPSSIEDVRQSPARLTIAKKEIEVLRPSIVIGEAAVEEAALASGSEGSPAHAEVDVRSIDCAGNIRAAQLVLAESWWTKTILVPGFRELFTWGFMVVPMMLSLHAAEPLRRILIGFSRKNVSRKEKAGAAVRAFMAFILLLASMVVAIPLELLLATLFVIGLVPIPQVRAVIMRMQHALVGGLGQSYVLVTGPARLAAMATQVNQDLRWLCGRCRTVVIVAHSQGAAVVHHALRREALPQIKALFTLGSGIKQLEILRQEHRRARHLIVAWFALSGPALLLASPMFHGNGRISVLIPGTILWFGFAVYLAYRNPTGGATWEQLEYWIKVINDFKISWKDFYASRDPVPNGPLDDRNSSSDKNSTFVESTEVHNLKSLLADHVCYWRNAEQVVAPIAFDIAARAGFPIECLTDRDPDYLGAAVKRRSKRATVLEAARWTAIVAAALTMADYFTGTAPNLWRKVSYFDALLATTPWLVPLATIAICYGLIVVFWNRWTANEITALTKRTAKLNVWGLLCQIAFFLLWGIQGANVFVYGVRILRLWPPAKQLLTPAHDDLIALAVLLAVFAGGMLAVRFYWPRPAEPVAKRSPRS